MSTHFKKLLKQRGFIDLDEETMQETEAISSQQKFDKKLNVARWKKENFNQVDAMMSCANEIYKIEDTKFILDNKKLFTENDSVKYHLTTKVYLEGTDEAITNKIGGVDEFGLLKLENDFNKIKNLNTILEQTGFDKMGTTTKTMKKNDKTFKIIKRTKPIQDIDIDKFNKTLKCVFRKKPITMEDIKDNYKCEQMLWGLIKNTCSKDMILSKKVREGDKTITFYHYNESFINFQKKVCDKRKSKKEQAKSYDKREWIVKHPLPFLKDIKK